MSKPKKPSKQSKPEHFQTVKGMSDIQPKDQNYWKAIWQNGHSVSEIHDFYFIETPILESEDLFIRGVGEETDVVQKQMYAFKTKGSDRVTMRPEGTAPVMRSYLEHHLGYFMTPLKVYYTGPMFRYERPQAGRERQFHQWGFEIIGDADPVYDGQIILATFGFLNSFKIKDLHLQINTIGCRVCRPTYRNRLKEYYKNHKSKLCVDCLRRYEKNPLRLLDCKEAVCLELKEKAPIILDCLCQACNNHFKGVLELIEDNGIPYDPKPYLVRGLDYYNRTVFEVVTPSFDSAIAAGGRYDYLSELIGGRPIPSVGAAIGLERLIEVMRIQEIQPKPKTKDKVFFTAMGDQAKKMSLRLINNLRSSGIATAEALGKKSLRAQMKQADKVKATIALIYGQKEAFEGTVIIRDMKTGAQETIVIDKLVEEVKRRI